MFGPSPSVSFCFFFFNDTATTEIYTLSLHDALPISAVGRFVLVLPALHRPAEHAVVLRDRKSTRLNSSHLVISYAVFCLKKKTAGLHGRVPARPGPPGFPRLPVPPRGLAARPGPDPRRRRRRLPDAGPAPAGPRPHHHQVHRCLGCPGHHPADPHQPRFRGFFRRARPGDLTGGASCERDQATRPDSVTGRAARRWPGGRPPEPPMARRAQAASSDLRGRPRARLVGTMAPRNSNSPPHTFYFTPPSTAEINTLSLHDALPI